MKSLQFLLPLPTLLHASLMKKVRLFSVHTHGYENTMENFCKITHCDVCPLGWGQLTGLLQFLITK